MGKIDFDALRQQVEAEFAQAQSEKQRFYWTKELTDRLIALVDEQKTVPDIAAALGVPEDKVRNKLQVLKARVPRVKPSKAEPENAPETHTEPPTNIDRMVFEAFSEFVGLVDDYGRTADCWRQAMHTIEQHLSGCVALVREHPETETHLCKVAAIVAYDEIHA